MLRKSGYNTNFCNHFEDCLEKKKAEYYKSLDFRKQGEEFERYDFNDTNDITSWIEFFCKALIRAAASACLQEANDKQDLKSPSDRTI